jgi:DNA polymerase III epsilon subunit-like protein
MNALVIDTETGTLDASTGALLDVAAVELRDGEVARTFRRRILPAPGLLIETEATDCNGYAADLWAELGAVPEAAAISDFLGFLDEVRGSSREAAKLIWAGHNTQFDRRFVAAALVRVTGVSGLSALFSHRDIDLMHLATIPQSRGIVPGRSLDDLRSTLLGSVPGVHDALTDATDTAQLLALFERRIQWVDG